MDGYIDQLEQTTQEIPIWSGTNSSSSSQQREPNSTNPLNMITWRTRFMETLQFHGVPPNAAPLNHAISHDQENALLQLPVPPTTRPMRPFTPTIAQWDAFLRNNSSRSSQDANTFNSTSTPPSHHNPTSPIWSSQHTMMARIAQMRALRTSGILFQNNAHCDLANHSSGSPRGGRVARPSPLRPNVANLVGQTKIEKNPTKLRSGLDGKARNKVNVPKFGSIDVCESEYAYYFKVVVPGVERGPDSFSWEIEKNGKVTIQGNIRLGIKRIRRKCPKGTLFVRGDRLFKPVSQGGFKPGPFNRSFRLPGPIDPGRSMGWFGEDGIFEAHVMKHVEGGAEGLSTALLLHMIWTYGYLFSFYKRRLLKGNVVNT
ncbi:hypothetical protein QJS10_CPB22g01503 [Acorus calamus]|uniref:SHSP domain-containing protein n=1 Tax=Acorus calamus TaxID=4465 RepID=A0AAV9C060_ACOCL|nr:hypothetical protein QJS10_CPB22g01503 [Acorus calamus]